MIQVERGPLEISRGWRPRCPLGCRERSVGVFDNSSPPPWKAPPKAVPGPQKRTRAPKARQLLFVLQGCRLPMACLCKQIRTPRSTMNIVRDEFYRSYPAEGDEKARYAARQKAFRRAVTNTQDKDLIGVREVEGRTFLWLESPEPTAERVSLRSAGRIQRRGFMWRGRRH
jgi:hypothetical protein